MQKMMLLLALSPLAGFCQEAPKPADAAPQVAQSYVFVKEPKEKSDPMLNEAAAFLEKNTVIYLATCDGQSPRVRPVRYTVIMDNKLVIATSSKKELSQQIEKNPNVEVSSAAADGSVFIRFKGKAAVCADADLKAKFVAAHPKFQKMFGENLAVYLIEPEMVGIFPVKGGPAKTKVFTK